MEKIRGINITRINKSGHWEFLSETLSFFNEIDNIPAALTEKINALAKAVDEEAKYMRLNLKSRLTERIEKADKKRDRLLRGLKKIVDGYRLGPDADKAEAAETIKQRFKDIRAKEQQGYIEESGLLKILTTVLEECCAAELETLGIADYVTALKEANDETNTLMTNRNIEVGSRDIGASVRARTASNAAYKSLIETVNSLIVVEGAEKYMTLTSSMNGMIARYKKTYFSKRNSNDVDGDSVGTATPSSPDSNDTSAEPAVP